MNTESCAICAAKSTSSREPGTASGGRTAPEPWFPRFFRGFGGLPGWPGAGSFRWESPASMIFHSPVSCGYRRRCSRFLATALSVLMLAGATGGTVQAGEAGTLPPEFRFSFRIARDDLNRILFPFSGIAVSTVSEGEIRTDGGALYVLPDSDAPMTLFVSPEDDPEVSFLLELIPDSGSARSYRIPLPRVLAGGRGPGGAGGDDEPHEFSRETALSRGFTGIWKALDRAPEIPHEIAGYSEVPEREVRDSFGEISGLCNDYQKTSFGGAWSRGEYLFVMLTLKNDLAVKTDVYCRGRNVLGYSLLNSTAVPPQGKRRIIVAMRRSV